MSETNVNVVYGVTVYSDGAGVGCSCPSRTYRSGKPCEHMRSVLTVSDVSVVTPVKIPLMA